MLAVAFQYEEKLSSLMSSLGTNRKSSVHLQVGLVKHLILAIILLSHHGAPLQLSLQNSSTT
jgi:hypothetical protein